MTVSLGLGTSASAAGASAEALLVHADRMLYRAKEGGRNRVEAAVLTVAE